MNEVGFPGIGSADGFGGKASDKETFYAFTGFTTPTMIYRYDMTTGKSTIFRQPKVDFNPADYETKQVFYKSKDGTKVPMFITHKKGLKLDGNNPTYLYGYGGFSISLTPAFSVGNLVWMEMGGVYAQPNLRGGGEFGEEWHQAGMKLKKQNVFDDFIAAAQWLIDNKYTSPPKARDRRGQQRWFAGRRCDNAMSGSVWRSIAGGRRDGHAAVSKIHHWLGLGFGLRFVRQSGRVQDFVRVFAAAQH